jgi:hypothetical protein
MVRSSSAATAFGDGAAARRNEAETVKAIAEKVDLRIMLPPEGVVENPEVGCTCYYKLSRRYWTNYRL